MIREQLVHTRQTADILVMKKITLAEEITRREVCPNLNHTQIAHILMNFTPDEYDTEIVHPGIISSLKVQPHERVTISSGSTEIDVDSSPSNNLDLDSIYIPPF